MLNLLPAEILLMIIDTPEIYRLVSQVVALGDEFILSAKVKLAFGIHKKQFNSVLIDIKSIKYSCDDIKCTIIKYAEKTTQYYSSDNINGTLGIITTKHIMVEPNNWTSLGKHTAARYTDSYRMICNSDDKNRIIALSQINRANTLHGTNIDKWTML